MARAFRVCLDLNVWVKRFLANQRGLRGTACQDLVGLVEDGRAGIGPLQLIISHTMLSRLEDVYARQGVPTSSAQRLTQAIADVARLGPAPGYPHVVLGGGVLATRDSRMPAYDPYDPGFTPARSDPEDGRVLDTAVAGRADMLVTDNFRDFAQHDDRVVIPDGLRFRQTAAHDLAIVRPPLALRWLRTGQAPTGPA